MDLIQPVAAPSTLSTAAATARSETTDLQDPDHSICEIIDLQMEMDCKKIE